MLVSGAGKRLGRAIALALAQQGARIIVHFNQSAEGAKLTCERIHAAGGEAVALQADLSRPEQARTLVDASVAVWGGLDCVVASAASFERVPFAELDDQAWDRSLSLNLGSQFALVHQAAPALRESRGSVVFLTCSSAVRPFRGYLPYVVSKGALVHLMRVLALELAPEVRVNAVAPGTVLPPEAMSQEELAAHLKRVPLARAGEPEDVVGAVLYLLTSPFVTGQHLVVDGGRSFG